MSTPIPIGPSLSRIGQIFVNVHDLDRAIAFYRDVLGVRFLFQAPPNMAFFDCDGIRLMLGVAVVTVHSLFAADDTDKAKKSKEALQALQEFIGFTPHEYRHLAFQLAVRAGRVWNEDHPVPDAMTDDLIRRSEVLRWSSNRAMSSRSSNASR